MEIKLPDLAKISLESQFKMDNRQRMALVSTVHSEGFVLLQRLMEDQIKLLNEHHINTDPAEEGEVRAGHMMVKVSGMLYHGLLSRIQMETELAAQSLSDVGTPGNPERPFYPEEFEGQG